VHKLFPPTLKPYDSQLEALRSIRTAFKGGKRFFVLEGPTGFGKSAVAKAVLNLCGKGFITSPVNTLVRQYSQDQHLDLTDVRGQSTYACRAFPGLDCEKAGDACKDHRRKCMDYVPARDAFWKAQHSVTNLHFLCYAPPIDGAVYPRDVLIIDEAHNLEDLLISMGRRKISPKHVRAINARPFSFPGEDRKLLDPNQVAEWLRYFESALSNALEAYSEGKEKRAFESLREGINFTLDCGDWITWNQEGNLVIAPMSAARAAKRLFRCAHRVLFMSATMGDIPLFLKSLGINETDVGIHRAVCGFRPENRRVIYCNLGSMSKQKGQPGLPRMLEECSRILRERPEERGIIHCRSRELQQRVSEYLEREFGRRILIHGSRNDRDAGVARLRNSRNGVLCAVAMTEGLDLPDDDARFCIFAKIPWPDLSDPYTAERKKRSEEWYENMTALSLIQGCGRVVRNEKDYAETFIFDSSFPLLLSRFPGWWREAVEFRPSSPPEKLPVRSIVADDREKHGS
jgi:Rad3-related DNA helicase